MACSERRQHVAQDSLGFQRAHPRVRGEGPGKVLRSYVACVYVVRMLVCSGCDAGARARAGGVPVSAMSIGNCCCSVYVVLEIFVQYYPAQED